MTKMLAPWRVLFALVLLLLSPTHWLTSVCWGQPSSGLFISPLNHTYEGRPGTRDAAEFHISNGLKVPTTIVVGLSDLTQTIAGTPVLGEPGSTPHSAAKWIQVTQGAITLAPGQERVVRANITVPAGVTGSYHAALTLQLFASNKVTPGSTAGIINQTVLPIHVFIKGTLKPAVELQGAELKPASGAMVTMDETTLQGKWALVPRVKNTGNSMVRLKGDVIITSNSGDLVGRYQVSGGDPDGQAILPEQTVAFPILINSTLPEAVYPAHISLHYQGPQRVEGYSAPLTLKPRSTGSTPTTAQGEVVLGGVERTGLQALIDPHVVIGTVQPGSVRTQRITVTNLEDFPVTVASSSTGLAIDTDGEAIALPDATTAGWMSIAPSTFRLGPQQSRVVSVRMNAATDNGDRWGLVQFAMSSANPNASALTTTARTTVLLRNAGNSTSGQAQAQKVALTRSSEGPIISVTVANPLNRPLAYEASQLQLTAAPDANAVTSVASTDAATPILLKGESRIILLPNSTRRLDFELPVNIQPAQYTGIMTLDGLAAAPGSSATEGFSVQFKLNLAGKPLAPTGKTAPKTPVPPAKKPAVGKPRSQPKTAPETAVKK